MTVQDRIDPLKQAIKEQIEQRDWISKVDWQDGATDAGQAAIEHDRIITMYENLVRRLEAQL